MKYENRIVLDPAILVGKPITKGTHIAVEFLLGLLAQGWDYDEIIKNYPQLTKTDIWVAIEYAAETLKTEKIYPVGVKG